MYKLKTSHRISGYITFFVAIITALAFFIVNIFFFVSWYRAEPKGFERGNTTDIDAIPQKEYVIPLGLSKQAKQKLMRKRPEKVVKLPGNTTGWQEENSYYGLDNLRNIDDRRWMIVPSPRSLVLIDVTQNIDRQNRLGLRSFVMWLTIVVASFVLSRYVVKASLKDIIVLSDSVKQGDISNLSDTHYFDHLPDDDEINTIADAINNMKLTIYDQIVGLKQFLAFASHELKTPLMVIQSSAESVKYTNDYARSLHDIQSGVKTMQHIIDQLNLFVKLDGNVYNKKEDVDLSALVSAHFKTMEALYADKNLDTQLTLSTKDNLIISSYPNLVNHIVSNLLDNAFKYADTDGTVKVILSESSLIISNTGNTINPKNLHHIWEPFWQQDKTDGHGTGLGLAIVKKAADYVGRHVEVVSQDCLTTFTLCRTC